MWRQVRAPRCMTQMQVPAMTYKITRSRRRPGEERVENTVKLLQWTVRWMLSLACVTWDAADTLHHPTSRCALYGDPNWNPVPQSAICISCCPHSSCLHRQTSSLIPQSTAAFERTQKPNSGVIRVSVLPAVCPHALKTLQHHQWVSFFSPVFSGKHISRHLRYSQRVEIKAEGLIHLLFGKPHISHNDRKILFKSYSLPDLFFHPQAKVVHPTNRAASCIAEAVSNIRALKTAHMWSRSIPSPLLLSLPQSLSVPLCPLAFCISVILSFPFPPSLTLPHPDSSHKPVSTHGPKRRLLREALLRD